MGSSFPRCDLSGLAEGMVCYAYAAEWGECDHVGLWGREDHLTPLIGVCWSAAESKPFEESERILLKHAGARGHAGESRFEQQRTSGWEPQPALSTVDKSQSSHGTADGSAAH